MLQHRQRCYKLCTGMPVPVPGACWAFQLRGCEKGFHLQQPGCTYAVTPHAVLIPSPHGPSLCSCQCEPRSMLVLGPACRVAVLQALGQS